MVSAPCSGCKGKNAPNGQIRCCCCKNSQGDMVHHNCGAIVDTCPSFSCGSWTKVAADNYCSGSTNCGDVNTNCPAKP
jgi:hypothetical protein